MTEVGVSRIALSGWNPRRSFEPEAFEELKKSIQEYGILEPLIVRPVSQHPESGYELVAGERRFRAAQELGLEQVPVVIKNLSDRAVREIMLIENLQRTGLEPLEEAEALQVLLQDDAITQEDLGKKLGKSQAWIANRLRLLKAPDELKELIISREITPKHAVTLLQYTEYPVFKEVILPDLKKDLQKGELVSVSQLEDDIQAHIRYHADEQVLPLHNFPYDVDQYRDFFDFSSCYNIAGSEKVPCICRHIYAPPAEEKEEEIDKDDPDYDPEGVQEPERFCLNQRCWSDKLNVAKEEYEKKRVEKVKTGGGDDIVDPKTLKYNEYERVGKWSKWSKNECQTCKSKKSPLESKTYEGIAFICLDPACAKGKEMAYRKDELRLADEEKQATIADMDAWINKHVNVIPNIEIRGLIKILCSHLWGDSIKAALKPWSSKGGKWKIDEVDKIPDGDLIKALLRLCIVSDLVEHNNHGVNRKMLEKIIATIEGNPLPEK